MYSYCDIQLQSFSDSTSLEDRLSSMLLRNYQIYLLYPEGKDYDHNIKGFKKKAIPEIIERLSKEIRKNSFKGIGQKREVILHQNIKGQLQEDCKKERVKFSCDSTLNFKANGITFPKIQNRSFSNQINKESLEPIIRQRQKTKKCPLSLHQTNLLYPSNDLNAYPQTLDPQQNVTQSIHSVISNQKSFQHNKSLSNFKNRNYQQHRKRMEIANRTNDFLGKLEKQIQKNQAVKECLKVVGEQKQTQIQQLNVKYLKQKKRLNNTQMKRQSIAKDHLLPRFITAILPQHHSSHPSGEICHATKHHTFFSHPSNPDISQFFAARQQIAQLKQRINCRMTIQQAQNALNCQLYKSVCKVENKRQYRQEKGFMKSIKFPIFLR